MILQSVDSLMLGGVEVEKAYCGDALVWERGGGRVIPGGYEELEYFDNQKRYSVNTLFKPSSGILGFECKIAPHEMASYAISAPVILGGFDSDPFTDRDKNTNWFVLAADTGFVIEQWNSGNRVYLAKTGTNSVSLDIPYVLGGKFGVYPSLTMNGTSYSALTSGMAVLPRDVWIGSNGAYNSGVADIDIYWFKLYDGETLARDMVPVKRLSDDKYGMWDFVTSSFYTYS